MFFARFVVGQQFALQHVFQAFLRHHPASVTRRRRAHDQRFQSVLSRARVAIRQNRDAFQDFAADLHFFRAQPARRVDQRSLQEHDDLLFGVRLQHVHFHPRKQRRNHFERRIFGGRSDQQNISGFDVRQKRILLRPIEAVHFIHENNRAPAVTPRGLRFGHHFFYFLDPGHHRTEGQKFRFGRSRDDSRQGSLPTPRRSPQQQRGQVVALNLYAQRLAWPK